MIGKAYNRHNFGGAEKISFCKSYNVTQVSQCAMGTYTYLAPKEEGGVRPYG